MGTRDRLTNLVVASVNERVCALAHQVVKLAHLREQLGARRGYPHLLLCLIAVLHREWIDGGSKETGRVPRVEVD